MDRHDLFMQRRHLNLERQQKGHDALAEEYWSERRARRAFAPMLGAWSHRVTRYRAANPGASLSDDLREEGQRLRADRASATTGFLPEGLRRQRAETGWLSAASRFTDAQALSEPVRAQAAHMAGEGKLMEGRGAFRAPEFGLLAERAKAQATQNVAQMESARAAQANQTSLQLGQLDSQTRLGVADMTGRSQYAIAGLETGSQRYMADQRLQGDLAQAEARRRPNVLGGLGGTPQAPVALTRPTPKATTIDPSHIQMLTADPSDEAQAEFDEVYGPGAARSILGKYREAD